MSGVNIPTSDQRGKPLDSPNPDIGAFQSQGFTLATTAGSTPQTTSTGENFGNPLSVTVTANDPDEPVAGGLVNFTVIPATNGAAATLSSESAPIGADGTAQVSATANSTAGTFSVTASSLARRPAISRF